MEDKIVDLFMYTIPSVITGVIAYYFFNSHTKNEEGRRRFLLHKASQKQVLPTRLQAYERLTLFLERIEPSALIRRITPVTDDKAAYEQVLIQAIEQEFEHNLSQQIYVSDTSWQLIKTTKNNTIQLLRTTLNKENVATAADFRNQVLTDFLNQQTPSTTTLVYLKKEISELW